MPTTVPDRPAALDEVPTEQSARAVYGGRYAVEREIGHGGMGRVYRARDLKIDRAVAVKVLAAGGDRERFEQEARAAGALNHPNVLVVFDVGEHRGEPYIVSELLEGQTLREVLKNGPLAPEEAFDFALQLADGLGAAHRKGIVHRDLKPDNLFVTDDGRLKILDFGIARLLHASVRTQSGETIGTPAYMSPEQVRAERVDARSDVFSMGAVLHEMLSGKPAFLRANAYDTSFAIVHDDPPAPPAGPLSAVVARCLQKDPTARYADAGEVLAALKGTSSPRTARVRRRVIVITAAMLVSTAVIAYFAWKGKRGAATASENVIAVFPFAVRGTGQSAYLGEGMVDLLSTTLSTTSLRTVDPHALLARISREGFSGDPDRGRALAAALGARRYVLGTVVEVGQRLRIHASIYDADAGTAPVREAKAEGDSARIFELVDDLSAQIRGAPTKAGERLARLAELTTSSPAALQAYLEGMTAKHEMSHEKATVAFQRAIEADPSFALAHFTLAYNEWERFGSRKPIVQDELKRAVALRSKLPDQDQQRLEAFRLFVAEPASTSCRPAREAARAIVHAHPDDFDTWLLLGEITVHCGRWLGLPPGEANEPLRKATELDPRSAEARFHLMQIPLIEGDTAELARRVDAFVETTPAPDSPWRSFDALVRHDAALRADLVSKAKDSISFLFWGALRLPGSVSEAGGIAETADAEYRNYLLSAHAVVTGRIKLARKRFEDWASEMGRPLQAFHAEVTKWYPIDRSALAVDRVAVAGLTDPFIRLARLGPIDAMLGDVASAEKIAGEIEKLPALAGSTAREDAATWTRAQAAWRAGRPSEALAAADRLRGDWSSSDPNWRFFDMTSVDYFAGEMLFALERYEEAELRLRMVSDWRMHDWYLAPRMRRLAQIAEKRGDRRKAASYYQRFVELWQECDPELRPQVDEARARLVALR